MEYLSIIFQEVYKILFLLIPVLVAVAMIVWLDRRVWAFVQKRQGPNVVGPFGLLQSLADALKYIFKEIIIPASSNKIIFKLVDGTSLQGNIVTKKTCPLNHNYHKIFFKDDLITNSLVVMRNNGFTTCKWENLTKI